MNSPYISLYIHKYIYIYMYAYVYNLIYMYICIDMSILVDVCGDAFRDRRESLAGALETFWIYGLLRWASSGARQLAQVRQAWQTHCA